MIRTSSDSDFEQIFEVINDAAEAYRGVIPDELWREPFVSREYLKSEIESGVEFNVFEQNSQLIGVMGTQTVEDVVLIRHSYVRTNSRRAGVGSKLLKSNLSQIELPVLVGCLKSMSWAISFYEKHGFSLVDDSKRDQLRAKYWSLSDAHVRKSVVLVDQNWLRVTNQ